LSNSAVVERSTPPCTSMPTAGRYGQIGQRSREPSPDSRSRTIPKMSGIQASSISGAGDVLVVSTFTLQVQQFAAWNSDAKTNPGLLETPVGSILSR
jgi:hypothetical protein